MVNNNLTLSQCKLVSSLKFSLSRKTCSNKYLSKLKDKISISDNQKLVNYFTQILNKNLQSKCNSRMIRNMSYSYVLLDWSKFPFPKQCALFLRYPSQSVVVFWFCTAHSAIVKTKIASNESYGNWGNNNNWW